MQAIDSEIIKRAFAALEKTELVENGKVSSEVMGYVSSFGAAVIQAGLVAAVIFFSDSGSDAKKRPELMKALFYMLRLPATADKSTAKLDNENSKKPLLDYLRKHQYDLDQIEEEVLESAIALKLALRSFEKTKF